MASAPHLAFVAILVVVGDLRADSASFIAHVLGLPRCNIAGHQVTESRVNPLQVVVAILLGNLPGILIAILGPLGHPDPAIVAQRFRHQGELRLVVTVHRDTSRVDLGVARVTEIGTLAMCPPARGHIAAHRIGRQEEHIAVPTGREHHRIGGMRLDLAGDHVTRDDAAGAAVLDDQFEHLVPGEHLYRPGRDLTLQRLVGPDQQLLTGLTARIEGALHLDAAE